MTSLTILEKAYGRYKRFALSAFRTRLSTELEGLEVQLKQISTPQHDWITVEFEGEDAEAASNLLRHRYGSSCSFEQLEINQVRRGKLIETGVYGYGLFVDIGILSDRQIDGFLSLNTLRRQLAHDTKIPLRTLIDLYGFLDHLPLEIKIDAIDRGKKNVQVSLSDAQIATYRKWVNSKLERLIVGGITRHHLKKAVLRTGHFRDIRAIERLGLLEEMITCKPGTNAPGLLAEIGPLLKNTEIHLFIPAQLQQYLS
jgi:hypothetical protein